MNISVPDPMKDWDQSQVNTRILGSGPELRIHSYSCIILSLKSSFKLVASMCYHQNNTCLFAIRDLTL